MLSFWSDDIIPRPSMCSVSSFGLALTLAQETSYTDLELVLFKDGAFRARLNGKKIAELER